ncbi:FapA family protein [Paucidesulfovibrio longus]|uniref:FapA family protein n=1 Tax=Paucidesulfovibrio longus TaxID=889 RepID=UPI00138AFC96|nr:FapA family protein [Paucidesulfovibrio longus]
MAERAKQKDGGRKSPDAALRFCLSTDGMKLGVSRYLPPEAGGRPLTPKSIRKQLEAAGVALEPEPGAAEKILERLRSGQDYRKIVLVRGEQPQNPTHGRVEPVGDLRMPVFTGQIIARKVAPNPGKPGRTIDGRIIEPTEKIEGKLQDVKAKAGANVAFDPTDLTFTAQTYGLATIRDGEVSIKPGLHIDDEEIHVLGVIFHKDHLGNTVTSEMFVSELDRLGVQVPPSEETLAEAFEKAQSTRQLQRDVIVAQGKEPEPGNDGWLEVLLKREVDDAREDDQGRIDYRHRASMPMARVGDMLARVHDPEPGKGGIDLYEKTIPAKGGKPLHVAPGPGVKRKGRDGFEATEEGILVYEKGVIMVSPVLVVNRDVGLSSGHIRAEFGSVQVRGSVTSGMQVSAPQNVVVLDAVESAFVEAGGDVEVRGGILMPDGGLVRAGGKVMAQFATNARIEAGGDVIIGNNVTNSRIETQGSFLAVKGKGVIQGGSITSHQNVEVNELGTEMGVATQVNISQRQRDQLPMLKVRGKIKHELERIAERLGNGDPKSILLAAPAAKRPAVAEVLKYRIRLERKFEKINAFMKKDVQRRQKALSRCRIKVRSRIHPGVTIKIGGRVLRIDKPVDHSQIYWDYESRAILIRNF